MEDRNIKEFILENAIVRVHIPNLTEEEKRHKTKLLHNATEKLLQSYERSINAKIKQSRKRTINQSLS